MAECVAFPVVDFAGVFEEVVLVSFPVTGDAVAAVRCFAGSLMSGEWLYGNSPPILNSCNSKKKKKLKQH